ncbi:MAG: TIGR03032 family protein [Wenzhouxiangella sp.]|nr:TIGR03032 family protein [Wenzhouxiangella sp.]MDR9453514.1 TIGR03032 family protein [Wenzhouxiangella sp.]
MTETQTPQSTAAPFELNFSRHFESWLSGFNASIAFSTYQAGKVFLIGHGEQGISIAERTFARCMGLSARSDRLYLASLYQLWRFNNVIDPGEDYQGYDKLFIPHVGHTTGDVDAHDIGIDAHGEPVFVNTLFSCLAKPSATKNFDPIWQPSFITRLAPEDRCHLNGLAMYEGEPGWVTMISQSDVAEGWRDHRADGGVVMDVRSNEVVCEGLSMPHSPRWYKGKLWVLNSGTGELGHIDLKAGRFEPVCFVPGFARGLAFHGRYALVGLSKARNRSFSGLALDEALAKRQAQARCGIEVIDLDTGDLLHHMRIDGKIDELFDVSVIPGAIRPMLLGFKTDEIKHMVRFT